MPLLASDANPATSAGAESLASKRVLGSATLHLLHELCGGLQQRPHLLLPASARHAAAAADGRAGIAAQPLQPPLHGGASPRKRPQESLTPGRGANAADTDSHAHRNDASTMWAGGERAKMSGACEARGGPSREFGSALSGGRTQEGLVWGLIGPWGGWSEVWDASGIGSGIALDWKAPGGTGGGLSGEGGRRG